MKKRHVEKTKKQEYAIRRWISLCASLLLLAALTACTGTDTKQDPEPESPPPKEAVEPQEPQEADDTVTVSTAAELVAAIAPDAHIILKPGDYNLSELTEEEIAACTEYVRADVLPDDLYIYHAPGLKLEAEESGTVRLITEYGYADVVTLVLCDGASLKGLVIGHEIEKGVCDADVLCIDRSENVTVEDCGLFGCGVFGIQTEKADGLTVTGTDIYQCTGYIFRLLDTREAVFENCRFYDNEGMFSLWGETEALVKDTEIFQNRGPLLEDCPENVRVTFRDCVFRNNPYMGAPEDWPCAAFVDCDLSAAPVPAGNAYDSLIRRSRQIAADPYGASAGTAGEQRVLAEAQNMLELWDLDPLEALGYAVEDLSGDGVPELVIGLLPDYGFSQYAVYTLVDGRPQAVFEDEEDSLHYLGNGSFEYTASLPTGMGLGTVFLSPDGAQLLWEDFYFTLDDIFGGGAVKIYHNTTGSLDPAESELTDWTMEYFYAWEPEYEELPMIPFS